jgi:hypothetical protein
MNTGMRRSFGLQNKAGLGMTRERGDGYRDDGYGGESGGASGKG